MRSFETACRTALMSLTLTRTSYGTASLCRLQNGGLQRPNVQLDPTTAEHVTVHVTTRLYIRLCNLLPQCMPSCLCSAHCLLHIPITAAWSSSRRHLVMYAVDLSTCPCHFAIAHCLLR